MRLFVAAELPSVLLDALSETSARLRDSVHGRFVGSDLFHVTLAFLGEVPQALVPDVEACVEEGCAGHAPFHASLGTLGSFGRSSSAVLWQGFNEGSDAWRALAQDVRASLAASGFSYDRAGFVPHVTLMRRSDLSLGALAATAGALPMPCVARGTVDTVTIFRSDLSGSRPRYDALGRVLLAGSRGGPR